MSIITSLCRFALWGLVSCWLGACSKPVVQVQAEIGEAGEFCISPADCADGLSCENESCCASESCESTCISLLEKDGTDWSRLIGHNPNVDRFMMRRCVRVCCTGKSSAEIEDSMRGWSRRIPGPESPAAGQGPEPL